MSKCTLLNNSSLGFFFIYVLINFKRRQYNFIAYEESAHNSSDSAAFANCFSETAAVFDEGKNYTGKTEIKAWIEKSSKEYNAVMKPLDFRGNADKAGLKAEVSGTFPGSPLVLTYNIAFSGKRIQALHIY
ncbi:nuclear transport factor 2 family protein [Flavobacterium anhuiense]|uniref:nuclear transport factor 2 family protein n=1 Tax=Flavobacterium anhuiense TaxID=459526 RepID=UPI0034D96222